MNKDNHINESIINDEVRAELKKERIDHMAYLPDMEVIPSDILDKVIADMDSYDYDKYTRAARPRRRHSRADRRAQAL